MSEWIKLHWYNLTTQPWSWGYESWEGKPRLDIGCTYYDGYNYYLHIGKLWVCCTWLGYKEAVDNLGEDNE